MPEKDEEKKILETIGSLLKDMTELQRIKLMAFGEGMEFMKKREEEKERELLAAASAGGKEA